MRAVGKQARGGVVQLAGRPQATSDHLVRPLPVVRAVLIPAPIRLAVIPRVARRR